MVHPLRCPYTKDMACHCSGSSDQNCHLHLEDVWWCSWVYWSMTSLEIAVSNVVWLAQSSVTYFVLFYRGVHIGTGGKHTVFDIQIVLNALWNSYKSSNNVIPCLLCILKYDWSRACHMTRNISYVIAASPFFILKILCWLHVRAT